MARILHRVPFKLGHQTIEFQFVKRLADTDKEHPFLFGETNLQAGWIRIGVSAHTSVDHLLSTCFHELIHAYIDITGYDTYFEDAHEESLVKMLESMLFWLIDKQLLTSLLDCDKIKQYLKPAT